MFADALQTVPLRFRFSVGGAGWAGNSAITAFRADALSACARAINICCKRICFGVGVVHHPSVAALARLLELAILRFAIGRTEKRSRSVDTQRHASNVLVEFSFLRIVGCIVLETQYLPGLVLTRQDVETNALNMFSSNTIQVILPVLFQYLLRI